MYYLIDHPGTLKQYNTRVVSRITGCTVIHTAESVMDTVGPDTGAEAVAEFIRNRGTPGSYHDIADSDSYVPLVPYEHAAWQDGTGSNPWALSISFACGTHHWRQMSPERRAGFLRQGARAFASQQAWRKSRRLPLTELRWITKAQSDAGASGFIEHGRRDPGRRTDPGIDPPNLFPRDEWLAACLDAIRGTTPTVQEDDDMKLIQHTDRGIAVVGPGYFKSLNLEELPQAVRVWGNPVVFTLAREFDLARAVALHGVTVASTPVAELAAAVAARVDKDAVDIDIDDVVSALKEANAGVNTQIVGDALRAVLREGVGA